MKYKNLRYTINMEEAGKRLRYFRRCLHLTIAELSRSTGLSIGIISETESGRNKPSPNLMMALHRLYGLDINWLLTGEGKKVVKSKMKAPPKDKNGQPVFDVDALKWYIDHVPVIKHSVLSFFTTYYYENKELIEKILKDRGTAPSGDPADVSRAKLL